MQLVNCRTKFEHESVCFGKKKKKKSLNFFIPNWPEPRQNADCNPVISAFIRSCLSPSTDYAPGIMWS